jgi:uncharacterized protein
MRKLIEFRTPAKISCMQTSAPVIQQGWLRVFLFLIVYLLFIFSGSFLLALALPNFFSNPANASYSFYSSIATVFCISLLCVYFFRRVVDKNSFASLGFVWKGFGKEQFSGFISGMLLITTIATILWLMKLLEWFITDIDITGMLLVFAVMMMVAIGEELVFRGYILNNLMLSMNKELALFVSALLFAVFHSLNPNFNLLAFINIFLAGILLGINYIFTRNLWFSIFFHFSWNFIQGPVLGFKVSGIELPALLQQNFSGGILLTGGVFGLEGSVLTSIVIAITCIIFYFVFKNKYLPENVN